MLLSVQVTSILILTFLQANAESPPGYVKPPEIPDKNPPKYEYGYNIEDAKGTSQGKIEARDGIYALGRYYVQGVDSTHNVQYYADDWGYHPFIEYGNVGPHSRTRTQLLLGVEAVKALASNKFTANSVPPKQFVTDTINSKISSRDGKTAALQAPQQAQVVVGQQTQVVQQPQVVVEQQPQVVQQQVVVEQQPQVIHQPQVVVEQQPQVIQQPQVVVEQQPQVIQQPQVVVEQPPQPIQSPQVVVEQPQAEVVQQPQIPVSQIEQNQQSQQIASDDSDSVVIEASGRRSQQNLIQENSRLTQQRFTQPQLQQVLFRQQISHEQAENLAQQRLTQPQLQQIQISQEISQQNAPQNLALQGKQIQDNLVINQQSAEYEGADFSANEQRLQQSQIQLGGFGSRLNLVRRRKPTYSLRIEQQPERLIASTNSLVSGQDVLNINGAVEQRIETSIEATTARALASGQNLLRSGAVTESSLINQPIVVADLDEKMLSSTENYLNLQQQAREQIYSTTANTIETISSKSFGVTEPSAVVVTPRPVISTTFLAPITAGVQLQESGDSRIQLQEDITNENVASRIQSQSLASRQKSAQKDYVVEIQKSLPYYLGKFEYEQISSTLAPAVQVAAKETQSNIQQNAVDNIELGKTLISFPESVQQQNAEIQLQQQRSEELQLQQLQQQQQQRSEAQLQQQQNNAEISLQRQQLPEASIKENFVEADQQQAQGIQHQVALQQIGNPYVIEKVVEKQVAVPVVQTRIVEKPVEVTRIVKEPYPVGVAVHVPVQVPVTVEKRVPVPVPVEKIVEKPVKVTQIVEKRVNVPQPYPVDRIVEKPVHVPVEVPKYIDRPYPVQVPVAQPVPYPVDRVVEKIVKQPYPVAVKVPVEVKVPVPVEKIVEKKVPVPQYIEKPVPVDRIVEKPVPHYIDRPYPVQVGVAVPVAQVYTLSLPTKTIQTVPQFVQSSQRISVPVNDYQQQSQRQQLQVQQAQRQQLQKQQLQNQFLQEQQLQAQQELQLDQTLIQGSIRSNEYLPPPPTQQNNGYLPPSNCDHSSSYTNQNAYYTIARDEYIGLSPPKFQENDLTAPRKFRNARSNFNSNLRIEYGFKPPLRPSQEIDENGNPIIREQP